MKGIYIFIFVIIMVTCLSTPSYSQFVKVGVGGGITQITGPEGYTNEVSDNGLGYSTEYNFGLVGKVEIPMLPITPRAFFLYHTLNGSGSNPSEVLTKITADDDIEYSQNIIEIGVGAQYNFIPTPLGFDPYIALDISMNNFGEFTSTILDEEIKTDGFTRFGGGIGLGSEISIVPMVNIDVYLSYKMFNLIGKEDDEDTVSAVTLDAFIMFNFL